MSLVTNKAELDRKVAFETGAPIAMVRKITTTFLWALADNLARFGCVRLLNFGQFHVSKSLGVPYTRTDKKTVYVDKFQVHFSKGRGLKTTLEQELEE